MPPSPDKLEEFRLLKKEKPHSAIFRQITTRIEKALSQHLNLEYAGVLFDTDTVLIGDPKEAEKARVYCHPLGRDTDGKLFALGGLRFKDIFPVTEPRSGKENDLLHCVADWGGPSTPPHLPFSYLVLDNHHKTCYLQAIEPYGNFFKVYYGNHKFAQAFNWNRSYFCLLRNSQKDATIKDHLKLIEGNSDEPNMKVMENMLQALKNACGAN